MKPKFRSLIAAFAPLSRSSLIVVTSLCAVASANADQTWTGASSALWNVAGNWNTTTPGTGDVAIFDAASIANLATTLGADTSILGIKVVDPTGTVSIAAGNTLTLGASGIDMNVVGPPATSQNLTFSCPISLGANQTWNVASGRTVTSNGGISGAFSLVKDGSGQLTLGNVANGFSGGFTHKAGVVLIGSGTSGSPANLGVAGSTITLEGGTITNGTGGSNGSIGLNYNFVVNADSTINMGNRCSLGGGATLRTVTGNVKLTINAGTTISRDELTANFNSYAGTLSFGGSGNLRPTFVNGNFGGMTAAAVELNGTASLTPVGNSTGNTIGMGSLTGVAPAGIGGPSSGGTQTYSIGSLDTSTIYDGGIVGNNNIAKVGDGTLTLTHATALTYTGTTTITEGILKVNGAKSGVGATAVNTGGTLAGSGSLAGTTSVNTGGTLAPGDAGTGNLSFANLTLNTGSTLKLGATPTANKAVVQAAGTLTLATGVNVDVNGFDANGTYDIIDITGANLSGTAASALTATNTAGGKAYTFSSTATSIRMTISASDPSNFWNVDGGGSWATATNWTKDPEIPNAPGAIAKFGPGQGGVNPSFSSSFSVTLDDNKTVGLVSFNDDFGAVITIDPGTPSGSLLMDNDGSPSSLVVVAGDHIVNAPVVMNSLGMGVDAGTPYSLTINGVVSGSGAALSKSGTGKLTLTGDNTYDGGTIVSGGVININSATSLGNVSGALRFSGGTLQLGAALSGITRTYQVSGTSSAIIDTDGYDFGYNGVISPLGGATGGLQKLGIGTMLINAAQTYTGGTTLGKALPTDPVTYMTGGVLEIASGGIINGGAVVVNPGTSILRVSGGSLTAGAASYVTTSQFAMSLGSATFNAGLNANTGNPSSNAFINLTGGSFTASAVSLGRCANTISIPTAGSTTAGLYVNGANASITGALNVGLNNTGTNSTASARIDLGSLTVDGAVMISIASPDRWSVIDVNGGTFTSTHVATGVQIGSGQTGSNAFLVRNGVATVERFLLQQPAASTETSLLNVSGGTLYIGAGGIVGNNNAGVGVLDVQLGDATLGAKASWTTLLGATLNGTTIVKAADATDAAQNITIAGVVGGTGNLTKTGTGTLTLAGANTYTGATTVSAGTLAITGDSSLATGTIEVQSGATLGGSGNIGGAVTILSGGHQAIAVAATAGSQPLRTITGALTLSGGDIVDLTAAVTPAAGSYTLVTATGGISGTLATSTINYNGITGTLTIEGGNTLKLTVTASGYASWASDPANGLTANVNDGPNDDPDNDSIDNLLEFVLGGLPMVSSSNILPELDASGANFIFTFTREDDSEAEVTLTFDHDTDLSGGWASSVAIDGDGNPPTVTVNEGTPATNPDEITISIPKGGAPTIFGRLRAEIAP